MKILGRKSLDRFRKKHAVSKNALNAFETILKNATWTSFADMKKTFNSVDKIGPDLYCFDIGGNNWRVIAKVKLQDGVVDILDVLTHADYDKWNKANR